MPSIEQLQKLLSLDESDAFVLYGLAQEHARLGEHDTALDYYDRCLAADETYCYAYFHKARSLETLSRLAEAKSVLETGLAVAKKLGDRKASGEIGSYLVDIEASL